VVEHLPSKHEDLSPNPSTIQKKLKKKKPRHIFSTNFEPFCPWVLTLQSEQSGFKSFIYCVTLGKFHCSSVPQFFLAIDIRIKFLSHGVVLGVDGDTI
jgi:hypothetical protein